MLDFGLVKDIDKAGIILLATVLANILLIRLATDTDDVRLPEADPAPVESAG